MDLCQKIRECKACPLHSEMVDGYFPVPGFGPRNAKIVLIGEALGDTEVVEQKPFQGLAGRLLTKMLKEAGIDREQCYITNVVKCRPTKNNGKANRPPTKKEINQCVHWLLEEIDLVKPSIVVPLGRIPTSVFLGNVKMETVVGQVCAASINSNIDFFPIIPAYHPSFIAVYGKKYYEKEIEIFKFIYEVAKNASQN